ncbi:hypothetical protein FG386_001724 [Cryptosporidium ryanae]|uniref:uncharacterized protein n=1 Tax=Cryptosporidium ryanae TaxID=515981 RepID=UPI00351A55C5|nr:hypothetical protein FG386_001724 [Cryptosporidium ryanae]
MFFDLECRLRLKTNRYLPEIPSNWLERDHLPTFSDDPQTDPVGNSSSGGQAECRTDSSCSSPFTCANYSEDGEIIVAIGLSGIYLLGAYTRTCFSAISYPRIIRDAGIKEKTVLCRDASVFGYRNQFLLGVFGRFLCIWDLSPEGLVGESGTGTSRLSTPTYIGGLSSEDITGSDIENLPYVKECSETNNVILSVQGIRVYYREEDVDIEFLVEFSVFVPLLVRVSCSEGLASGNSTIKIASVRSVLPDKLYSVVRPSAEGASEARILSISVNNGGECRVYSAVFVLRDKLHMCLFEDNCIIGFKSVPNYGKRQARLLRNCKTMFNQTGDLFIIQFPDKFSIYNIAYNQNKGDHRAKSSPDEDEDLQGEGEGEGESCEFTPDSGELKCSFTLLYTYTQIIQKEWITSIAVYSDRVNLTNKTFCGPVSKMYPCGVVAVSTISSSGQCFYYLMKVCSHSDERSYASKETCLPCRHSCKDNTGSNMIVWKVELTKLNGIRKLAWQPGEPVCLAIQFMDKLRNTKLQYDDFLELTDPGESTLDKNPSHKLLLGNMFFIEPNSTNDDMLLWSRLMTGFTAIHKNREYIEQDDEFDAVPDENDCIRLDSDLGRSRPCPRSDSPSRPLRRNARRLNRKQITETKNQIKSLSNKNNLAKTNITWITKNEDTRKQFASNFSVRQSAASNS